MTPSEMEILLRDIANRVTGLDSRVTAMDGRLHGLTDEVKNLNVRVGAIEQILPTLATHDEIRAGFSAVDERFDTIDWRFEAVDERFDTIDGKFEAVDERFDAIDRRFEAVDERFDAIDRRFEAVDRRFDDLEAGLSARIDEGRREARMLNEDVRGDIRMLAEHLASVLERDHGR